MLVHRIQTYSGHKRHEKLPDKFHSMANNQYFERPLKNNSDDLSFKGLSVEGESKKKKQINPTYVMLGTIAAVGLGLRFAPAYKEVGKFKISELSDFFSKYNKSLNSISGELIEHLKGSKLAEKLVKFDDAGNVTIYKKTVPQLIWDGLKYPFTILPGDVLNGTVKLLSKIKPLEKHADKILATPLFKKIRQRSKLDAKVNSLQGLFETKETLLKKLQDGKITDKQIESELFQRSVKMLDIMQYGAYDTKQERALNRLVSGLPPAIFLSNDAYNLSRTMDDDPAKADKEKKTRFKQETARILSSAYLTLITMGALNKYINNSKIGIMLMTGTTVLITEAFSRLINGKHIKRLTPEEARAENERNNAPEKSIKADSSFKANSNKAENKTQKPLLSFDTLMKASATVIAAGFGIKGLRKSVPSVEKSIKIFQEPFIKLFNKLTKIPDYTISKGKFEKIINVLEENGFTDLSKEYKAIAETVCDASGTLHLGIKNRRYAKPAVIFAIEPFKFIYNTVTLPYRIVNKAVKIFVKKPEIVKTSEQIAKEIADKKVEVLAKTFENIGKKALDLPPDKFKSYINDTMLKAFNVKTMSNVSNAELSNLAKTAATAATLWFLMTDNYNMVMLKSNGVDKKGAETKFKERFVQEGSRLFYSTLLIDLFNATFRSQYNASLLGMSLITLTNTTMSEWLTRKSVGMPVKAHTRAELENIERKQNEATGFEKGFYDFMKRLTGKRSIESYKVKSETVKTPMNFNGKPVFEQMALK